MVIEKITASTIRQAGEIYTLSWQKGYQGIIPQKYLDELSPDNWVPKLGNPLCQNFILKDNDRYVAVSSISPARDEKMKGWGEIISLYVLPKYFRKGYGKVLFSYVTDRLRADGFEKIYLWALEENHRARAFYEAMGFVQNGDTTMLTIEGKDLMEVRYVNHQ